MGALFSKKAKHPNQSASVPIDITSKPRMPPLRANAMAGESPKERPTTKPKESKGKASKSNKDEIPNIVIFGQTGVGKSSLINMLSGNYSLAPTSDSVSGGTSQCTPYTVVIDNQEYRLWDTPGLNGTGQKTLPDQKAKKAISNLLKQLSRTPSGVNLLVYCITGGGSVERANFDLVWGIMCRTKAPILIVLTKRENDIDNETWWEKYWSTLALRDVEMTPPPHASVATTKGKGDRYAAEYEVSYKRMSDLIRKFGSSPGWKVPATYRYPSYWSKVKKLSREYEYLAAINEQSEARKIVANNFQSRDRAETDEESRVGCFSFD